MARYARQRRQAAREAARAIARGARSGQQLMLNLLKGAARAERTLPQHAAIAKRMRTGRVIALIDIRRRAQAGFRAAAAAPLTADDALPDGRKGGGREEGEQRRKRPWESRGRGEDWLLEQDAEAAARRAAAERRVRPRRALRVAYGEGEGSGRSGPLRLYFKR